jgi:hypothetical protein
MAKTLEMLWTEMKRDSMRKDLQHKSIENTWRRWEEKYQNYAVRNYGNEFPLREELLLLLGTLKIENENQYILDDIILDANKEPDKFIIQALCLIMENHGKMTVVKFAKMANLIGRVYNIFFWENLYDPKGANPVLRKIFQNKNFHKITTFLTQEISEKIIYKVK